MTDQFSFKAAPQTRRSADPVIATSQEILETQRTVQEAQNILQERAKPKRKRRTAAELEAAGLKSKPRAAGLPPDVLAIKECVKILRGLSVEDAQRVFVTLEALFK